MDEMEKRIEFSDSRGLNLKLPENDFEQTLIS
jgi:hypothetical protein